MLFRSVLIYPDFHEFELAKLSMMPIVPTHDDPPESTVPRRSPPNQCYFKAESSPQFYSKLFAFVDFGPSANGFLNACGTKGEPSVEDITAALVEDPPRFFQLAGGRDK